VINDNSECNIMHYSCHLRRICGLSRPLTLLVASLGCAVTPEKLAEETEVESMGKTRLIRILSQNRLHARRLLQPL